MVKYPTWLNCVFFAFCFGRFFCFVLFHVRSNNSMVEASHCIFLYKPERGSVTWWDTLPLPNTLVKYPTGLNFYNEKARSLTQWDTLPLRCSMVKYPTELNFRV